MMKHALPTALSLLVLIAGQPAEAQDDNPPQRTYASMIEAIDPDRVVVYQEIDGVELGLHLFYPDDLPGDIVLPAYVVIHGGGWRGNDARRFYPYANSLVEHGYVGISIDYRLASRNQNQDNPTTVFDCVRDARAAVRYVRAHAEELNIDPDRIAVGGGSAGAHLAAGCALFDEIDHAGQDLTVSCRPDALVLLFGVLDTSPDGYGNAFIGDGWRELSPRHHIRDGMPPTILFHGTSDGVAPMPILEDFCDRLEQHEVPYQLVLEQGGVHGHINNDMDLFDDAAAQTLRFLNAHMQATP